MRVAVLYSRRAGAALPLDQICDAIERHGHDLVSVVDAHEEVKRLLEDIPDVMVAAGGDGTIAHAARVLARGGVPLGILPLGTANNIAKSLAIQGSVDDLVLSWHTAKRVPLDLGVAEGAWGRRAFVEGVGAGLIPAAVADMRSRSDGHKLPAPVKLTEAVRAIGRVLSQLQPVEMTIVADGVRTSGTFLLVEVLNMPSIGPNLVFSPNATPTDGLLHVVMAGEEHRDEIARYLKETLAGRGAALSLPSTAVRHVTLKAASEIHFDDELLSPSPDSTLSLHVDAGALEFLA